MKKIFIFFLTCLLFSSAHAQQPYYFSQFFKVAPSFNPAFTGVDDFLDVKLMHRSQWGGFDGAPSTEYLGIYKGIRSQHQTSIKEYSLRISNPHLYDSLLEAQGRRLKGKTQMGIGGFISYDAFGPYSQFKGSLNYSFQVKVGDQSFLSFGLSAGFANDKLDISEINPGEDVDEFYDYLLAQGGTATTITLTPGILFYSPKFYLGYSAANLGNFHLQEIGLSDEPTTLVHYISSGYQFPIGSRTNLQTSVFYYYLSKNVNNLDVNVKVDFNHRGYAGLSYRTSNDMSVMAGFTLRNKFQFGYAYDMKVSGTNDLNNNVHELSLGFLLFNKDLNAPYTW